MNAGERLLPHLLAEVAVDRCRLHPLLAELLDQTVGAALGAHEDERTGCGAGDRGGDLHLVELVDEQEAVGHLLDGHRRRHHLVKDRVLEVSAHHVIDRAVERRREQQRLVAAR